MKYETNLTVLELKAEIINYINEFRFSSLPLVGIEKDNFDTVIPNPNTIPLKLNIQIIEKDNKVFVDLQFKPSKIYIVASLFLIILSIVVYFIGEDLKKIIIMLIMLLITGYTFYFLDKKKALKDIFERFKLKKSNH